MLTLDQIELTLGPKSKAFYSAHCGWWTTDPADLGESESGLPCCPYCGSVLFEGPAFDFIARARKNPGHYGPQGLSTFAKAHHSNLYHATAWDAFHTEPIRYPRKHRTLSAEKSIRCVRCGSEFSEAETKGADGCPKCGATGVPMGIADDVTVKVNWHELRILGMWADNWAAVCDDRDPEHDAKGAVTGILRRLQAQHPGRSPLTLLGELRPQEAVMSDLRERWPSLSPRERDAMVAKVRTDADEVDRRALTDPSYLRAYTTNWHLVGPLLDEMLAAGLMVELGLHDDGTTKVLDADQPSAGLLLRGIEGETWPEVIALAYVLWKEGQR